MAGVEATFAVVIVTPFTDRAITGFAKAEGLTKNVEKTPMLSSNAVIFFLCTITFFLVLRSKQNLYLYLQISGRREGLSNDQQKIVIPTINCQSCYSQLCKFTGICCVIEA